MGSAATGAQSGTGEARGILEPTETVAPASVFVASLSDTVRGLANRRFVVSQAGLYEKPGTYSHAHQSIEACEAAFQVAEECTGKAGLLLLLTKRPENVCCGMAPLHCGSTSDGRSGQRGSRSWHDGRGSGAYADKRIPELLKGACRRCRGFERRDRCPGRWRCLLIRRACRMIGWVIVERRDRGQAHDL